MRVASRYGKQVARAFGQALRATRTHQGISQDCLGNLCDLDSTYPSLLERGLRGPTITMLLRLARVLRVRPEQLLADTVARLRGEVPP